MAIIVSDFTSSGESTISTGSCELCYGTMTYEDYTITFKDTETGAERSFESLISYGWGDFSSFPAIPSVPGLSQALAEDKEAKLPWDWEEAHSLIWSHI